MRAERPGSWLRRIDPGRFGGRLHRAEVMDAARWWRGRALLA